MIELLRTALLLTGSLDRAERLTAAALAAHGDCEDAYFTLYRRFLRPWRRDRALQVALDHEGRPEEEVARLFGWRQATVRRRAAVPRPPLTPIPDPDISRLDGRVRALRARRKLVRLTAAVVAVLLLAEPVNDGMWQAIEVYSPPVPYAVPAPPGDLPRTVSEPIYSASKHEHWELAGASGTRWILRDARLPEDVVVSPDGRKLAYDSDERSGPVIHDLTTGVITETPYPLSALHLRDAGFSTDGRYLAAYLDDETIVVDTNRPTVPKVFRSDGFIGWAHDGIVSSDTQVFTVIRPDGTALRKLPYDPYGSALVTADGHTLVSHGEYKDKDLIELVDLDTGKVRQRLPVKGLEALQGWKDPETVLVYADEAEAELNLTSGALTPLEDES